MISSQSEHSIRQTGRHDAGAIAESSRPEIQPQGRDRLTWNDMSLLKQKPTLKKNPLPPKSPSPDPSQTVPSTRNREK